SHSASAGSRPPAQVQYASASACETCTTGWSQRPFNRDPGPSGRDQAAPGTARHQGAATTARVGGAFAGRWPATTKDQPNRSASVTYRVARAKRANCSFVTVEAASSNAPTVTSRTGPSRSLG